MNCYKNGTKIRSTVQGAFNDHRKVNVTSNPNYLIILFKTKE